MTVERYAKLREVLSRRQPDLTIVADEVHKGRNIAAITRSADAVGIDRIHAVRPEAGFRPYRGTALGTQKWVDVELFDTVTEPLQALRARGFQLIFTAPQAQLPYWSVDYTRPTALVLGSERQGLSAAALGVEHTLVSIPMHGMGESFNVSAACAIVLAEAQRQRQQAGYYERSRLEPSYFHRRLFQWAQPELAAYCDARGLEYPELDDAGDLAEPSAWYRSVREMQ